MKRFDTFFQFFIEILFWIFLVWSVYLLLFKIFGHSPTDTQLLSGGFGAIVVYLFGFSFRMGKFTGRVEEFMKGARQSFQKIDVQFQKIDVELHHLKQDISELKHR